MRFRLRLLPPLLLCAALAACGPSYSPDTYASTAMQQANKVEKGVIVGVRPVAVTAAGTVGAVTGAAAGGVAGAQVGGGPVGAFSAIGGSLVGGLVGTATEHTVSDTKAFEYIVRKPNNDLISVTQKDDTPLALGQKVLVIAGTQARVVPDYTMEEAKPVPAPKPAPAAEPPPADTQASSVPTSSGETAHMPDDPAKAEAKAP
jgi:outer membrane lipoprotein SlyB